MRFPDMRAQTERQAKAQQIKRAFRAAFPHTIPIFAGFCFLGMTYGIYMNLSGFAFWYPMLMSLTIFAGSVEFVAVNLLLGAFNPLQALAMTLMINARHLFYGISMLDKYRGTGWKKVLPDFRHVRRELFYQLYRTDSGGGGSGLVYVLCHPAQPFLLVLRGNAGRNLRFFSSIQHRRARFCHDRHVCGDLSGTVAQGKKSHQRRGGNRAFPFVLAGLWSGGFYHPGHACHFGSPHLLRPDFPGR